MEKTQNNHQVKPHHDHPVSKNTHNQIMMVFTEKSDVEIWGAFKGGDEEAFNYIYRKYVPGLYNYGLQITKDDGLVKDCIQVLFINLRRKRKNLSEVKSIKGYLFTIFYRDLSKSCHTKKTITYETMESCEKIFPMEMSHETKLIKEEFSKERKKKLERAINKLPSRQRQALLLLYREEMSYKEIMQIMDFKDVKSARKLVYRALDSVRGIIQNSW